MLELVQPPQPVVRVPSASRFFRLPLSVAADREVGDRGQDVVVELRRGAVDLPVREEAVDLAAEAGCGGEIERRIGIGGHRAHRARPDGAVVGRRIDGGVDARDHRRGGRIGRLVGRAVARAGDGRPCRAVGHPGHVTARCPTGGKGPRCLAAHRPRVSATGLEPDGDATAGREVDPVVLVLEPLQVRRRRELAGSGLAACVGRLDGCRLGNRSVLDLVRGRGRHRHRRRQDADDEDHSDHRARDLAEGAGEHAGWVHGHPRVEVPARPPDRGARAPAGGSHHCGALRRGPQPYAAAGRAPITPWSWSGMVRVGQVRSGAVAARRAVSGAGTRRPRPGSARSRRSRWRGSASSPSSTSGASRSPCMPSTSTSSSRRSSCRCPAGRS